MPIVPPADTPLGSTGQGQLQQGSPSQSNLLMAAAIMHGHGRLAPEQQPSMPKGQGMPTKSERGRVRGMVK